MCTIKHDIVHKSRGGGLATRERHFCDELDTETNGVRKTQFTRNYIAPLQRAKLGLLSEKVARSLKIFGSRDLSQGNRFMPNFPRR